MGLNLDLHQMLGIPTSTICPQCEVNVDTYADDYDVECGNPNPEVGQWVLSLYCPECEHEWTQEYNLLPVAGKLE